MLTNPAFVIVDLQNDFCNPQYLSADENALRSITDAVAATASVIERFRTSDRSPIFVRTHHDDRSNSPVWAEKYAEQGRGVPCQPGTPGAAFVSALDVQPDDLIVTKHRYSAFHGTPLDLYLSSNEVTEILVAGVNTEICVAATVFDGYNRDYDVTVLADCTAPLVPERHDVFLDVFDQMFGTVQQSTDIEFPTGE